jgi:hypothetical protein
MELVNDNTSENPTKNYLFWQFPNVTLRKYVGDLYGFDSHEDYLEVVRLEVLRVHIKQICDTVGFMADTTRVNHVNPRYSARFVKTLEEIQEHDLKDVNKALQMKAIIHQGDSFGFESYINNFKIFIFDICKLKPTVYQLRRFKIKCEIDYEIIVSKRNEAVFEWEKKRRTLLQN